MQGWSPDFVAKLTEDAVREGLVDEIVSVSGAEALRLSRALAREEGILCGISSGATFAAALDVCTRAPAGSNVLCMLPDTGERYLSTPLFDDVDSEMNAAETEISRSTPNYRFDPAPSCPLPSASLPASDDVDPVAEAMVADAIADDEQPVLMFALEWCEFCWSVRKLFSRLGVPYRSVDLDSVELQADDFGGKIRAVLARRTGTATIPQIFVGGRHVGGCTELFDAHRTGHLHAWLGDAGLECDGSAGFDASELLPGWLHTRTG